MNASGSEMTDGPSWPLNRERQELVVMLGEMIRRFGTERFLSTPLVRADAKDFPDTWKPSLHGIYQTINRLCWLAYIDPEVVVHDNRAAREGMQMLSRTEIEIKSCAAGVVTFELASIGNDDVAGLLSHKVGQAYLELVPGEPFRTAKHESDEVEGTVAAYFLGLGVLAANSSMYRRHRAEVRGRSEVSEQEITMDGGLGIAEATMLLAIQDLLRDDVQTAHETLLKPQREWLEGWKDVLDPYEDELREMLGIDDAPAVAPVSRKAAPRPVPTIDEDAHKRFNVGAQVMRVRHRSVLGLIPAIFLAFLLGAALISFSGLQKGTYLLLPAVGFAVVVGGGFGWWRWCRPFFTCSAPGCQALIAPSASTCKCGGAITKTISEAELKDHYKQLRDEEDARDELIDPSEFAGDPDAVPLSERRVPRARSRDRRLQRTRSSETPL